MKYYNLNQVAMITGLTTRTLRNHINQGTLIGEKKDGAWVFTEDELDRYLNNAEIRRKITSNQHSVVYDFLADSFKKTNRICTIMDFTVPDEEAIKIARFFNELIGEQGEDIEFRYITQKHFARFILSGSEEQVSEFMKAFYAQT